MYLPYSFFNLLCPLFSIMVAITGFGIKRSGQHPPKRDR
jgi:Na+/H+ antiporter NhaC